MRLQRYMITAVSVILLLLYVPAYAAAYDDAGIISERIEKLPEEEVTEETAKEAEQLMDAYNELPMAEKLNVENYSKLERICKAAVRAGYVGETENTMSSDQARAAMEQVTLEESANTETGTTEYIFQSSPSSDEMSIVIHYLTDINGDGEGDAPARIILISPKGVTTPLAATNTRLLDDTMDIGLVWERTFMPQNMIFGRKEALMDVDVKAYCAKYKPT